MVRVESELGSDTSLGSGVIFRRDEDTGAALILTNQHVIDEAERVFVTVRDSERYRATFRGQDTRRDLAVLEICCDPTFHSLPFADPEHLQAGVDVFAMGYALGFPGEASFTRGSVSAIRRDNSGDVEYVQTQTPINSGNSGGPLLTLDGRVLGINTFVVRHVPGAAPVEGLGFALAFTTVEATLPELVGSGFATGGGEAPPSTDRFGPTSGSIPAKSVDGSIPNDLADISWRDGEISAGFDNPFGRLDGDWSYGFMFRPGIGDAFHAVGVGSDGRWFHLIRTGDPDSGRFVDSGASNTIRTSGGQSNFVRVIALENDAWLFINGEFVGLLDLGELPTAGVVRIAANMFEGDGLPGQSTSYEDFRVMPWEPAEISEQGTVTSEEGKIGVSEDSASLRDFIAVATFTNPPSSNWSYGFLYRNFERGRFFATVLRSDGDWYHYDARGPGAGEGVQSKNSSAGLSAKIGDGAVNSLRLIARSGLGWFFINDDFRGRVSLTSNTEVGQFMPIAGLFSGDQPPGTLTDYSDLRVWRPA